MACQRNHKRIHVQWPAASRMKLNIFDQTFKGIVMDVTPEGMFFQPLEAYFNDIPISHKRYLNMFKTNDEVNVQAGKLKVKAKVVWKGKSKEHNCIGIGLNLVGEDNG